MAGVGAARDCYRTTGVTRSAQAMRTRGSANAGLASTPARDPLIATSESRPPVR